MWVYTVLVAAATILFLPSASPVNPNREIGIQDLLSASSDPKKLNLYGREVNMQELFGYSVNTAVRMDDAMKDLLLTITDYKDLKVPPEYSEVNRRVVDRNPSRTALKVRTGGLDYVENDYTDRTFKRWTEIPGKDTPSAIAHKVLTTNQKFVVIMGEPGSGKTVALTKILNDLRASEKVTWSLMIDLKKITMPQFLSADWNVNEIFSEALRQKSNIELFQKMIKFNPQKINLLLDNFHEIPKSSMKKEIFKFVENLNKGGAGVVLTTTPSIADSIPIPSAEEIRSNKYSSRAFVQIGQLRQGSLDRFIEQYLRQKLGLANNYNSEYAASISKAVGDMYFHKSFGNVKELLDMVITGDKSVFVGDGLVGLQDYLKTETATAKDYGEMLSATEVNKVKLYEKFISRAVPSDAAVEFFGLEAWKRIRLGSARDLLLTYEKILGETPTSSGSQYTGNGEEFGFLVHDQHKNMFVHEHYDQYFSTKAMLNKVKVNSKPHKKEIIYYLRDSQNLKQIELIEQTIAADGPTSYANLFKEIFYHVDAGKILNNLLNSKSDTMAAEIFKQMQPRRLQAYLRSDRSPTFETTYRSKENSRQDMLFKGGMVKSVKMINEVLKAKGANPTEVWNFEKFKQYTVDAVSKPRPSLSELKVILETAPSSLKTENFLNEHVHKLVVNGGLKNRLLINALVYEGAVPPNINVNGESPLNVALKTRDLPLVKYLVEELKIPIASKPKMTHWLVSALDSNFMPRHSMPDFWKMMKYVITEAQVIDLPQLSNGFIDFSTPLDRNSIGYQLVAGSANQKPVDEAISTVKENPEVINDFPSHMKEFRRKYVLTRGMKIFGGLRNSLRPRTLTEILLKYRGLDELSPTEMEAYEDTIRQALKQDVQNRNHINSKKTLTKKQLEYIQDNLVENIGTKADFDFAVKLVDLDMRKAGISDIQCAKMISAMNEGWRRIENPLDESVRLQKILLKNGVLETRADFYIRNKAQSDFTFAEVYAGSGAGPSSSNPGGSAGACDFLFK